MNSLNIFVDSYLCIFNKTCDKFVSLHYCEHDDQWTLKRQKIMVKNMAKFLILNIGSHLLSSKLC